MRVRETATAMPRRLPLRAALERDARLDERPEAKLYRKGPGMEARLALLGTR